MQKANLTETEERKEITRKPEMRAMDEEFTRAAEAELGPTPVS